MSREKECKKCGGPCELVKCISEFNVDRRDKSGFQSWCRVCAREYRRENREVLRLKEAQYRKDNPEYMAKARKKTAKWNKANPDYKDQWYQDNNDTISISRAKYYKDNTEIVKARRVQWGKDNPDKVAHLQSKHRAAKLCRTVAWSDDWKIQQFYLMARKLTKMYGVEFHVDHIVPLQGKLVSGLHVENNLQIITATENLRKNNKFIPG